MLYHCLLLFCCELHGRICVVFSMLRASKGFHLALPGFLRNCYQEPYQDESVSWGKIILQYKHLYLEINVHGHVRIFKNVSELIQ